MKKWFESLFRVWRREFYLVTHDEGVMLFFLFLPLIYPILYTLIYNKEMVEEVPFVVVDDSRTPKSRELVQMADATPEMQLVGYASDMAEARRCLNEKVCYGIMYIPSDYSQRLVEGEQAVVPFYYDMSLLMRYRTFMEALTDIQMAVGDSQRQALLNEVGELASGLSVSAINSQAFILGDVTQGFASFVIPGVLILIIQQSIILGVVMLCGTSRDRRRKNSRIDPLAIETSAEVIILGKSLCYVVIYIPLTLYMLHFVPLMFGLPHVGSVVDIMLFIVPFLFASAFLGQVLQVFVRERETSFLVVVFMSLIFLFLSGLTWPRYAMEFPWRQLSDIIPATWGVEGFVNINSNSATLSHVTTPYIILWILAGVYFVIASFLWRRK
ncbi:MAG: ABC transporter permease [Muribaculaceae bacterium]|nr:ABC transporter permease [Muribaculaceae bacterium]